MPRLSLIAIAIAFISFTSAALALDCSPNSCDAECKQEWEQNKEVISAKAMRWISGRYAHLCGSIPNPKERNKCYEDNIADANGITDGNFEPLAYQTYLASNWNPTFVRCSQQGNERAKANRAKSDAADAAKQKQRSDTYAKAVNDKAELQARYRQEEEQRLQAEREQREIQAAVQAQATDALNQQAETNFRVQSAGSNVLQQGFMSILQGALNK